MKRTLLLCFFLCSQAHAACETLEYAEMKEMSTQELQKIKLEYLNSFLIRLSLMDKEASETVNRCIAMDEKINRELKRRTNGS